SASSPPMALVAPVIRIRSCSAGSATPTRSPFLEGPVQNHAKAYTNRRIQRNQQVIAHAYGHIQGQCRIQESEYFTNQQIKIDAGLSCHLLALPFGGTIKFPVDLE